MHNHCDAKMFNATTRLLIPSANNTNILRTLKAFVNRNAKQDMMINATGCIFLYHSQEIFKTCGNLKLSYLDPLAKICFTHMQVTSARRQRLKASNLAL